MDTMSTDSEYVTEHDCRTRTDAILKAVNETHRRLFVDNGTLSHQSILAAHTKAIKGFQRKTVSPKTIKEAVLIMSVKAPYAIALIVVACLFAPNARQIIARIAQWATGV